MERPLTNYKNPYPLFFYRPPAPLPHPSPCPLPILPLSLSPYPSFSPFALRFSFGCEGPCPAFACLVRRPQTHKFVKSLVLAKHRSNPLFSCLVRRLQTEVYSKSLSSSGFRSISHFFLVLLSLIFAPANRNWEFIGLPCFYLVLLDASKPSPARSFVIALGLLWATRSWLIHLSDAPKPKFDQNPNPGHRDSEILIDPTFFLSC